jgi:5-methyltetrahydropteroyltriglutamate--homocysteine methyltransferase
MSSIHTHTLGYPRIGSRRELKRQIEAFWTGEQTEEGLALFCRELRARHWRIQRENGVALPPSNDFSLYDHMLDMGVLLGAIPERFGSTSDMVSLDTYFLMARGQTAKESCGCGHDAASAEGTAALEMTKWFDTNYHYLVPELRHDQTFRIRSDKPFTEFTEATSLGILTKPILVGPVTFLSLAKATQGSPAGFDTLALLPRLLPVYVQILQRLRSLGAEWVQMDEPIFATDLSAEQKGALSEAYETFAREVPGLKLLLATYFGELQQNMTNFLTLPVAGVHVDGVRGVAELDRIIAYVSQKQDRVLSLGLVDGRNVWRHNPASSLPFLDDAIEKLGVDRVWLAPSCSLLHVPVSAADESELDALLLKRLAFADEKLRELSKLAQCATSPAERANWLDQNARIIAQWVADPRLHVAAVRERCASVKPQQARRASDFAHRIEKQQALLQLPPLPTTTIGSFPQTESIRSARARWRRNSLDTAGYERAMEAEITHAVRVQEEIGLDVLVHGEAERTDMVEYFGEMLDGFAFTRFGWVQSYGTRCVKPPLLFGDVSRPAAMTVRWSTYAQSQTQRPMKAMLTGPITILQWSLVRDDLPRAEVARLLAFALRDEVNDLEAAGLKVIQVDEPALREGLPLRRADRAAYLAWATEAFRLATSGVRDETQIHTHMCYCEFGDVLEAIAALDADVISLETSRSQLQALNELAAARYANDVGPGVYDIHSPRVPSVEEIAALMAKAMKLLPKERLWINPDCGLKTRRWPETIAALKNMVAAALRLRSTIR